MNGLSVSLLFVDGYVLAGLSVVHIIVKSYIYFRITKYKIFTYNIWIYVSTS